MLKQQRFRSQNESGSLPLVSSARLTDAGLSRCRVPIGGWHVIPQTRGLRRQRGSTAGPDAVPPLYEGMNFIDSRKPPTSRRESFITGLCDPRCVEQISNPTGNLANQRASPRIFQTNACRCADRDPAMVALRPSDRRRLPKRGNLAWGRYIKMPRDLGPTPATLTNTRDMGDEMAP
jgi:hypothetical protein